MSYIFLDESGDLGFDFTKHKTSSVFVVTFLFVNFKEPIERIVRKVFKRFTRLERAFHDSYYNLIKQKIVDISPLFP